MNEWISVTERLPEHVLTVVFVFWVGDKPYYGLGYYDEISEDWERLVQQGDYARTERVTHWLPLPEPPKMP